MNTILPPKAVFRSVTRSILAGQPWSGSWIGNPYLRQHTRILAKMFRTENRWTRRLKTPCLRLLPLVEARTTLLTQVDRNNLNVIPALLRLAEYQDHWIRNPESWQPNKQLEPRDLLLSLIQHLLNQYELPVTSSNNRSRLLQFCADQWQPMEGIKPFEQSMEGWFWQMVELKRQDDLQEEARDMQHCVSDYGWECKSGKVSIFSLRSRSLEGGELDRDVTLEVNCNSRKLQQVKAWRNRRPSDLTRKMVLRWCVYNQINPGVYTMW